MMFRHNKTGKYYMFLGLAIRESDTTTLVKYMRFDPADEFEDYPEITRPADEFFDGRFIPCYEMPRITDSTPTIMSVADYEANMMERLDTIGG